MGKYLNLAREYVKSFKPIIERRTGVDLNDIVVKEMRSLKPFNDVKYLSEPYTLMFVKTGRSTKPDSISYNTIYVNEDAYENMEAAREYISVDVNHELSHLLHHKTFEEGLTELTSDLHKDWLWRRFLSRPFREGFAEFMSLDCLADLYDEKASHHVFTHKGFNSYYQDFPEKAVPYERGYKFFRKVLSTIGKHKVLEVARAPPLCELEMKMPLLYILRNYPAKGIKNIPKFTKNAIKRRIKKMKSGYAPMDFVFPGEFKNLAVKAIKN